MKAMIRMMVVVGLVLAAGIVRADVVSDMAAAEALYRAQDYTGAITAFQGVLSQSPASNVVAQAYVRIGMAKQRTADNDGAIAAFEAAANADASRKANTLWLKANIMVVKTQYKASRDLVEAFLASNAVPVASEKAQLYNLIGKTHQKQQNWLKAENAYLAALSNAPLTEVTHPSVLLARSVAREELGNSYLKAGKASKAVKAYADYVLEVGPVQGATNETTKVWQMFNKVDPVVMGSTDYAAFLQNLILAVRVKEGENSKFLGMLKSELAKIQK